MSQAICTARISVAPVAKKGTLAVTGDPAPTSCWKPTRSLCSPGCCSTSTCRRGEGSIHQRQDGRWSTTIDLGWHGGKRKRKVVYGRTRREVADKLCSMQQKVQAGAPLPHRGYEPQAHDRADMTALGRTFGLDLPAPY